MFIDREFYIGFRDIDFENHIKIKSMLSFMEDLGGIHSNIAGLGVKDIPRTRKSWVIINWKLEFLKKPSYADVIRVKTWSRGIDKIFAYRDFFVYDESGEIVAKATSKWLLMNIDDFSICKLDEGEMAGYELEDEKVFEEDFSKLKDVGNYIDSTEINITRDMIDVNGHVHNLDYIDFASRVIPQEVMQNAMKVEVLYKKEIRAEDKVKCYYAIADDSHYAVLKSQDDKVLHAIICLK